MVGKTDELALLGDVPVEITISADPGLTSAERLPFEVPDRMPAMQDRSISADC